MVMAIVCFARAAPRCCACAVLGLALRCRGDSFIAARLQLQLLNLTD